MTTEVFRQTSSGSRQSVKHATSFLCLFVFMEENGSSYVSYSLCSTARLTRRLTIKELHIIPSLRGRRLVASCPPQSHQAAQQK